MSEIRGASQINDQEFLTAYNDQSKSNLQVIEALNTDWTAVGVKLRSARVGLHTTVNRTGGKGGSFEIRPEPLSLEAQIWKKHGIVQPQPNGPYVTLQERLDKGLITIDGDLNVTAVETAAATTTTTSAPAETTTSTQTETATATTSTQAEAPKVEFAFTAEIFGSNYRLAGPTKEDALHALFVKLQELNFSKVAITDRRSGRAIGINDIQAGGEYRLAKQLTAAGGRPSDEDIADVMSRAADADGSTQWPGMTYEQGVENALRWVLEGSDNPMED